MAKTWKEVSGSADYKSLSIEDRDAVRADYFSRVIAPTLETAEIESVHADFMERTKPGIIDKVRDVLPEAIGGLNKSIDPGYTPPQEVQPSVASVVDATTQPTPMTWEGINAKTREEQAARDQARIILLEQERADPSKTLEQLADLEIELANTRAKIGIAPSTPSDGYGIRNDGTPKGKGWLGELKRPDGKVSTELSVGVGIDGKEMEIPLLVPTLNKQEINTLLNLKEGDRAPDSIIAKAVDHAKQQMMNGNSPFIGEKFPVDVASTMLKPEAGVFDQLVGEKEKPDWELFDKRGFMPAQADLKKRIDAKQRLDEIKAIRARTGANQITAENILTGAQNAADIAAQKVIQAGGDADAANQAGAQAAADALNPGSVSNMPENIQFQQDNPLASAALSGTAKFVGGAYGAADALVNAVPDAINPIKPIGKVIGFLAGTGDPDFGKVADKLNAMGEDFTTAMQKRDFSVALAQGHGLEWMLTSALSNAPSLATSAVGMFNPASAGIMLGTMAASSGGGQYRELVNQGYDQGIALLSGIANGVFEYAFERVSIEVGQRLLSEFKALSVEARANLGRRIVGALSVGAGMGVTEGAEEIGTQIGQNATDIATGYAQEAIGGASSNTKQMKEKSVLDGAMNAFMGGIAGGMTHGGAIAASVLLPDGTRQQVDPSEAAAEIAKQSAMNAWAGNPLTRGPANRPPPTGPLTQSLAAAPIVPAVPPVGATPTVPPVGTDDGTGLADEEIPADSINAEELLGNPEGESIAAKPDQVAAQNDAQQVEQSTTQGADNALQNQGQNAQTAQEVATSPAPFVQKDNELPVTPAMARGDVSLSGAMDNNQEPTNYPPITATGATNRRGNPAVGGGDVSAMGGSTATELPGTSGGSDVPVRDTGAGQDAVNQANEELDSAINEIGTILGAANAQGLETAKKKLDYIKRYSRLKPIEDTRVADMAEDLRATAPLTGWAQRGGRMLRKSEDYNHPDYDVISRTKWIPHQEWYAGMANKLEGDSAIEAVEDAIAGRPMKEKAKRFVSELMDIIALDREARDKDASEYQESGIAESEEERLAIQEAEEAISDLDDEQDIDAILEAAFNSEPTGRTITDDELDTIFEAPYQATQGDQGAQGAETRTARQGGSEGGREEGVAGQEGLTDAKQEPADAKQQTGTPELEIVGQTPTEVATEERDRAEQAKRAKAELDRIEVEAKQKRIDAEIAARQEASAENFTLGQSAEDALAGQGDIFSQGNANAQTSTKSEAPKDQPSQPQELPSEPVIETPVNAPPSVQTESASGAPLEKQARTLTEDGMAYDGKPINPGDTFRTLSGRTTTPYPKQKSEKYASQWLIDNAIEEAKSRGDGFNKTAFGSEKVMKGGGIPPASRDSMMMYLFGHQPVVVPSILKPLNASNRNAKPELTIDDIPPMFLQNLMVKIPVLNTKTNQYQTGEANALEALAETSADIDKMKALLNCLTA